MNQHEHDDLTTLPLSGLLLRAEVQLERSTVHGEAAGALVELERLTAEVRRRRATNTVRACVPVAV